MRVLSGVQPSGKMHLGNYFGAVRQHIGVQEDTTAQRASRQILESVGFSFVSELDGLAESGLKTQLRGLLDRLGRGEVEPAGALAAVSELHAAAGDRPEGALARRLQREVERFRPEDLERYYFIANFHSLTSIRDAELLRRLTLDVALDYMALGLDPKRSCFYRQSDVPQVTELSWLLTTLAPMGLLERCHAYKDKVARGFTPEHGLFAYPVLMAADILIVDADTVPVGQDQKQHIEVTRDLAQKFNGTYGEVFVLPEPYIVPDVAIVPGTDGQKMSKSYGNTIDVFASGKELKRQVMGIVTDSTPLEAPKDPEKDNVLAILRLFAEPEEILDWERRYRAGGTGYGHAKLRLVELVDQRFAPARQRRAELAAQPALIEEVLQDGAVRARALAAQVLQRARRACGID